jgi:alpha-methylacyl-CoA racemase
LIWDKPVGENVLDGGAPWYGVYSCRDGKFISVGAIEPRFYSTFIWTLSSALQSFQASKDSLKSDALPHPYNVEYPRLQDQYNRSTWPALRRFLEAAFMTKQRDEWAAIFIGTDSCVAPVLEPSEVGEGGDETGKGRGKEGAVPDPSPRLVRTPGKSLKGVYDDHGKGLWKTLGEDTKDILIGAGFTGSELERLIEEGQGRETKL